MALATSDVSARVGRGAWTIDSSIWVAVITGFPCRLASRMIFFWIRGTSSNGSSTPRSPRATMMASEASRIPHRFLSAVSFSILAISFTPARHQGAQLLHVLRPAHEGERDVVDAQRHGLLDVFDVLFGQRRRAHLDAGQVHALVGLELAAVVDHRLDPLVPHGPDLEREQAVVEQNPGADPHVLGQVVVRGGNLSVAGRRSPARTRPAGRARAGSVP